MKFRQLFVAFITILILACATALIWALVPVTLDTGTADISVTSANGSDTRSPLLQEAYFEHQDQTLHYVYAGDEGDDVVFFIHGFPSYWFSFIRQLQALKGDFRVVAIDGLGAGMSDVPRDIEVYKLEAMAAQVNALIDHLGVSKVHIVGHDWGAAFALGFAQRYPDRVHSVTGLSAPPQSVILELLETQTSQREIFAYVEYLKKADAILVKMLGVHKQIWEGAYEPLVVDGKLSRAEGELFRVATQNPKRINAHLNWYRANIPAPDEIRQNDYWPARKARLTAPALLIWGEDDPLITPEVVEEIKSISDNLELIPMQGVGHWPHIENSESVTASIRAFLTRSGAVEKQ